MDTFYLIQFIATSSIIMGVITFLVKRFIDKSLDVAIERYKSSLQQDLELYKNNLTQENERLKIELHKTSLEHQIRYTKLYEERGEIIKWAYSQIVMIGKELEGLTTNSQGVIFFKTENCEIIKKTIYDFENDLEIKRLFFDSKLCDDIEALLVEMAEINFEMYGVKTKMGVNQELQDLGHINVDEKIRLKKDWAVLEKKTFNDIKNIRRQLERSFAKLLGVE